MKTLVLATIPTLFLFACSTTTNNQKVSNNNSATGLKTDFIISPTGKNKVNGQITVTQKSSGVIFKGRIRGFEPNSSHGIHIHEKPDCGNNAKNAGGHFSPDKNNHGALLENKSHAGDLGNIKANKNGIASFIIKTNKLSLDSSLKNSIKNRSMVIHGGVDDLKSQPSGNSGKRIACAVIK